MAKINVKPQAKMVTTHEGARVIECDNSEKLRRAVQACMLWEDSFYVDGKTHASYISELIGKVKASVAQQVAIDAREKYKLRHAPLLVAREMLRHPNHKMFAADTIEKIIQRPDELTEFLAIYWTDQVQKGTKRVGYDSVPNLVSEFKKTPIAAQAKKGLARAFTKFDEYQLAKYNRDGAVKLRDVLFLSHAKPKDEAQAQLWKRLVNGELATPDTWETNLSAGASKKETFERLMKERKLGGLALLRNLRNMTQAGCDEKLIRESIRNMKVERILPFRFITAAKYAQKYEDVLEEAMLKCLGSMDKMPGKTVLLVDVSGSMQGALSGKSEMNRFEAACGVAMLAREVCEDVAIYTFSNSVRAIAPRRGFGLRDEITRKAEWGGTYLKGAIESINKSEKYDRIIVFTDEQSHDGVGSIAKGANGYIVNVASYINGVGYNTNWVHVNGFSEATIDYIREYEKEFLRKVA